MANEVVESSVQIKNKAKYRNNTIFRLGTQYDIIPKWWSPSRDAWFRGYWYQENFLASAVYAIANRNAAFGWELAGLASDIEYAQNLLQFSEFGEGWQSLMIKSTIDELTQDNGFFVEAIRPAKVKFDGKTLPAIKEYNESSNAEWFAWDGNKRIALKNKDYTIHDSPMDLPIGISHLDAGRCRRTGDVENPVVYIDRHGKQHLLKWWQVLTFNEMPSPIEKMNGVGYCLDGDSMVLMENKKYKRIRSLVNEKSTERVMSIDFNGNIVPRKITNWYKNSRNGRNLVNIRGRFSQIVRGSRNRNSWITEDHPVLTPKGWINAGKLKTGDKIVTGNVAPNRKQIELIIGTLLGDSTMYRKSEKTNSRLSVGHEKSQEEWLDVKINALKCFGITKRKQTVKWNFDDYKGETDMVYFETHVSPSFNWIREEFYKPQKHIPLSLLKEYMSPILICAWYLDDGHIQDREKNGRNRNPRALITTTGFEKNEVFEVTKFMSDYGYECNVYNDDNKYSICFTVNGSKKLFEDIAEYIPENLRYKLPRNSKPYNNFVWDICHPVTFVDEVVISKKSFTEVRKSWKSQPRHVYCIDVKDTHNFITAGIVVHNCALTRVFRASHIMQSIALYNDEKISGRFTRAVFLTNIDPEVINDAISMANEDANNRGLIRYSQPIVATTLDPGGTVSLETINLAEIPDNFNFNDLQNWYIANLALALGVDFGFLAPLPGKGLGTASQSETMAKQAKGKSSRLFMDMISNALNFKGVLPQAVQFKFVEQDTEEEERVEKIRKQRADRHKIYVEMGFTTPTVSQQMLSDAGDIPPIYLEQMGQEDTTPAHTVEGDTDIETQEAISEEESEVEEKQHQHITIEISESSKNLAHKFVHNLPYGKIKARQQILFKKLTVFEHLKNAAQQAFGKKQIEVPEINNPELEQALSEYGIELDELVTQANTGMLTQNQFEEQLTALVTLTLIALYSETSGLEPDNFTDQDADNLEDFIAVNLDSVKKLADDIYDGRYQPTEEDEERAAMLLVRMGMWLSNALGMAYLGLLNNPTKQERKITWKLGIAEHCPTCIALDGQVHTIQEWWDSNFYPRNEFLLLCHGFNCKCRFDDVPNSARIRGSFAAVPTQ